MKKAVLAVVFAILISANAQAFEFHGIKSGMQRNPQSAIRNPQSGDSLLYSVPGV